MKPTDGPSADVARAALIDLLASHDGQPFRSNRQHSFDRVAAPGRSLVVKSVKTDPPDARAIASLRHEYDLLSGLDVPGIVRVAGLVRTDGALALVMHDAGPLNLADQIRPGPVALGQFWDIALQLAQALAGLHAACIVHRNVSPANIVWDADAGQATLVDFSIAIPFSALAVDSASPAQLEGTLAYMSPEQTGRTGRSVDARSDLYALGATLYALLTGAPPFAAQDPLEIVHAHLARRPRPPHLVNAEVPPLLSEIVLKLLEKEPERRYMTAEALAADLHTASLQWRATGTLIPFALAARDVPRALGIPEKLYGRGAHIDLLALVFGRACQGQRQLLLVTGDPGIGKTALVHHLAQPVAASGGHFIAGKFDQLQRSIPYAGLVQAFRMLVRQLLTGTDRALSAWRQQIQAAVAPNGQILVDLIPEIDAILGPQPPVAELGQLESKNRFSQVFTSFVNVFAKPEHPFVLFLDDLQWGDAASLQLIEQWMDDAKNAHLLIVGAYRDNEVGPAFAAALAALRDNGARLTEIHLGALDQAQVAELISDALNQEGSACAPLAQLIVLKTAGNPFFIRRLLHLLHAEALIRFEPAARRWQWDLDQIARAPVSDNVLDLMVQMIDRLPAAARELLQAGACIGHRFDLATLAAVTRRPRTTAMNELWPALEDGLLLPLRDAYKAPRHAGPLDDDLNALPVVMRFVHDRVQQAAYSLLSEQRKQALHLDIGRRLLQHAAAGQTDGQLFELVDQLDLGVALITEPAERLRVAELNLAAGRKAKASAAYQAAFAYLSVGRRLLPQPAWRQHPALAFALHRELAECAYLTGQHALAEQLLEAALEHAPSPIAKADLYSLRVLAATVAGDWAGALRWGREGLAVFGHEWPLAGLAEANDAEAAAVMRNVGAQPIAQLVERAAVGDEPTRACMRLLSLLGPPAYFSGSDVLTFLVTRSTNLSLRHGPSEYSAYAYVFYGALHNARHGDYDVGYAFGRLALALAQRFGNRAEQSRTLEVFGLVVHAWRAPLRDSLALMKEGHRAGVESGELAYAAFNLCGILINGLPGGAPLAGLLADADSAIEFATRYQNRTGIEISLPFRQFARSLMGHTRSTASFDDDSFDARRFLADAAGNQTAMGQFWVLRLQAAYLFGDLALARRCAQEGQQYIQAGILGMITSAEHAFYTALTGAAEYAASAPERQPALLAEVAALHAQLAVWAGHCADNFLHKQKLVEAELARIGGAPWQAMELFAVAIEQAQQQGFIQDAALGNAMAAQLFLQHRQPRLADVHLRAAVDAYRTWGASAKVHALLAAHGPLAAASQPAVAIDTANGAAHMLDTLGLIRASQAIAAETVPERLFERILQIVVEVAGAQTGLLLLGQPGALRVRARVTADEGIAIALDDIALAESTALPQAIARYVARLKEPLVLADAATEGPFAADPEARALGLRSVLCVPLKKQEQVVGLLYLENKALTRAFTAQRVEVVQALAAQAAISLENSTLLAQRERAAASARFLASAGAALAESLDYARTLERVAALPLPTFADWCFLDLADDHGGADRARVVCADPRHAELAAALQRFSSAGPRPQRHPASAALHAGAAVLWDAVPAERLRAMAVDEPHHALLRAIAPRALIAVPMVARGRTLGVLTFIVAQPGKCYDQEDLVVAGKFADRCALALDSAALYKEAQDAVQVREDFLAVASHELRTPLMPLQLQIHLIERRLPTLFANPESAAWLAKSLATLQRQGKRLERLVNELLDISRITGGQLHLELGTVNLGEVAREVIERLTESGEVAQSGSALTLLCDDAITGHWDRLRLEQVMLNLLSNAFKYGEGKPVFLHLALNGPSAVIEVTDHGFGIASAHLQRIFGRFERAVSASSYGGLGLGLYIASEIVTALGGSIHVTSTLGEGSTFTVMLPLACSASHS